MRSVTITILILFTFLASGYAQDLETSYEQLNAKIRTAQELLKLFPDVQAGQLIENAVEQRNQGFRDFNNGRNRMARTRLNAAHGLIDRAIELLSRVPVERIQEQVDDLLRQAESLVTGSRNTEANRLLKQARENRQRGQQAHRNKQLRRAMEYYRVAKFYAERAIGLVNASGANVDQQSLDDEKNRYLDLYNRASELTENCQNRQAQQLVKQAVDQYQNIAQAVRKGNNRLALNLYFSNTRLLLRAIDLCQGVSISDREAAVEAVEMLGNLLQSVQQEQNPDAQSNFIINRVGGLYQRANQALSEERFRIALRQAQLGRKVLDRLWNSPAQQPTLETRVQDELSRLKQDIDRTRANKSANENIINAADKSVRDAEQYLASGNVRMALEMVYAGNRFLNSARTIGRAGPEPKEALAARLQQLERKIDDLKSENQQGDSADFINLAERMLDQARGAMNNNQIMLANEYVKIGMDLLDKLETGP